MTDRTLPLPKFWPGDRVEVRYEINGHISWVAAEIVDAQWKISHGYVSYWVYTQFPKDHFWIRETGVRATERDRGNLTDSGVKEEEWIAMNSETPREAIVAKIVESAEFADNLDQTACGDIWLDNPDDVYEAVIAHLWQRAESPEVVEAVRDRIKSIANDPHIKARYQMYAEVILETALTELIGPKPEESDDE